ncbi:MAG: cyclic nucleotide-binding domain-containing protein [Acidobacteriota bacterium]
MGDFSEMLSKIPLLQGLEGAEFEQMARRFAVENYPAGSTILEQGYGGLKLYVLVEGKTRIFRTLNGSRVVITTLEPPETFGEVSILDGDPASATVEAESDVVVLTLGRDEFYDLMEASPELAAKVYRNLLRTLCQRLRTTTNQVQDYFAINKALCENESFRSFYKLFCS